MPNMYKHEIEECIDRARAEKKICVKNGKIEEADHIQRRIESLQSIHKKARYAVRTYQGVQHNAYKLR